MAFEYGVDLKLNTEKATKDIDALLAKFNELKKASKDVKLNLNVSGLSGNDVEKQRREYEKTMAQMSAAAQRLATQRLLDEQKVRAAQDKTASDAAKREQQLQREKNATYTQRLKNEESIRREQQKTTAEAEKQIYNVQKQNQEYLKAKQKTRQEEQKARQESEKASQQEAKTERENIRTTEEKVNLIAKLYRFQQMVNAQKEREQKATERAAKAAQKQAEAEEEIRRKMAEQARLAAQQAAIRNATSGWDSASHTFGEMSSHYATIGRGMNIAGNVLNNVSQAIYYVQNAASQFFNNMWSYTQRIGGAVISAAEKLAGGAFEQYKTLETATIGFSNFFNGSPTQFTQQVRQEAEKMPGVSAQDLIRGIQYIAPIAGGNSQLALGAAQGVMKSILYSGNDVSEYGTNALQNIMQIASGNFTYADIKQMLRAMPTLPALLQQTSTGGELLSNGAITTENMKAYIKKYGQSGVLELFKEISEESPAKDIYDKYEATFSGVIEETSEILKNRWNDAMENSGLYRSLKDLIEKLDKSGVIERVFNKMGDVIARIVNFLQHEDTAKSLEEIFNTVRVVFESMAIAIKNTMKEIGKSLGIVSSAGGFNTEGIRKLTRDLSQFVKGLVQGFGGGLKKIIGLVNNLKDALGENAIHELGKAIGFLASPMGQAINLISKFTAGVASLASGLATSVSGITGMGKKLMDFISSKIGSKMLSSFGAAGAAAVATGNVSNVVADNVAGFLPVGGLAPYTGNVTGVGAGAAKSAASEIAKKYTENAVAKTGMGVTLAKVGGTITSMVAKWLRGGIIASITIAIGDLINSIIDLTGWFGDAADGVKTAVSTITKAAAGFAMGFTLGGGGIFGTILGAVGGLTMGIIGYTQEIKRQQELLQQQQKEEARQAVTEQTAKDLDKMTEWYLNYATKAGLSYDPETEEGRTVKENLRNWIENQVVSRDENGDITGVKWSVLENAKKSKEAMEFISNSLYQQKMNDAMANYTMTEGFSNASKGGSIIDLDTDKEARQRAYDLIVRNLLNGTDAKYGGVYDYTQSQEKVIRDYLDTIGMDNLTTDGLTALENQEKMLEEQIKPTTANIADKVAELDDKKAEDVTAGLKDITEYSEKTESTLREIAMNVRAIAAKKGDLSTLPDSSFVGGAKTKEVYEKAAESYVNNAQKGNALTNQLSKYGKVFGGSFWDDKRLVSANDRSPFMTSRGDMAQIYGKNANSNDDWIETYNKLEALHAKLLSDSEAPDPLGSAAKEAIADVLKYIKMLQQIDPNDFALLFALQDKIEQSGDFSRYDWAKYVDFRARGGIITPIYRAMGGRGVDSVPAYLQPGEYVMRASSVQGAGLGVMDALNRGDFGAAARNLGAKFSNSWNNSRSYSSAINNNQKTVNNNITVNNRTRASRLNTYFSLANRLASSF